PDIYSNDRVERESYILRGTVVQGNSGGPLISPDGQVLGLIFGASVDDTDTGYAISAEEARTHIGDGTQYQDSANTQECVAQKPHSARTRRPHGTTEARTWRLDAFGRCGLVCDTGRD